MHIFFIQIFFLKVFGDGTTRPQKLHPTFKKSFNTQQASKLSIENVLKEGQTPGFVPLRITLLG
jgi:hypothetical protein